MLNSINYANKNLSFNSIRIMAPTKKENDSLKEFRRSYYPQHPNEVASDILKLKEIKCFDFGVKPMLNYTDFDGNDICNMVSEEEVKKMEARMGDEAKEAGLKVEQIDKSPEDIEKESDRMTIKEVFGLIRAIPSLIRMNRQGGGIGIDPQELKDMEEFEQMGRKAIALSKTDSSDE